MFYFFVCVLFAAGFILFCFAAGFVLFRFSCVRSVYSRHSFVDKSAHVKDEKVIIPLQEAKNGKREYVSEMLRIVSAGRHTLIPVKPLFLSAELCLHGTENPVNIAVLVHGFSDSARGMSYLAQAYYNCGFSVLSIDMRAHGESEGRYAGLGYVKTDGTDIALWLRCLRRRFGEHTRIILHGVSMGASAVIQSAYGLIACTKEFEAEKKILKLVVADCGFYRFSDQVAHQLRLFLSAGRVQNRIFTCVAAAASFLNFCVNGFFFGAHNPGNTLRSCPKENSFRLLIFHGSADTLVPPCAARQLYESAGGQKKLIIIEHAPHIGSWFYDAKTYMREITAAFETECAKE